MKKGLKKGLSLLVISLMITGIVPASVMAEQNEIPGEAVIQTASMSGNGQEDVFVFENGQVIWLSNTKDEASMKMATSQNSVQLKEESPQNASLNPEIQADALENAYEVIDVDGGVRITKYNGIGGDVVVPATLNDKMVLEIGMAAFENNKSLTSVFLPEGLKRIGKEAFQGCHKLIKVTLPESLEAIEGWAFASCILTSISLPKNVSIIGGNPFNQCPNLTSISLSPLNPNYQVIGGLLVDKTGKTLIACPGGALNPVIPEGVTAIGDQAFAGCHGLTNVILPESLVSIGSMAFIHTGLTTINLPKGVSSVERWSLGHCEDLSSITVAHDNSYYTSINGVLFDKDETTLIACPAGKTSVMLPISLSDIGSSAFYGCDKLMVISLPENVRNIADQAFAYCKNLTNLVLPEGAIEIGNYTFQGCDVLSRVVIPASVTKIGTGIFRESPLGTIYGGYGSYAETYANANSIPFVGSDVPAEGEFTAFLGQDLAGNYYEYKVEDFNNAYLAYQIKPTLPLAKMYQQFLSSKCRIVALKDLTKGYMDYNGAATASLMAQMKGEAFDINAYFGSSDAKSYAEMVENVKIVDKEGNTL